jgi:polyribonucleotide nucleotidyltransferase
MQHRYFKNTNFSGYLIDFKINYFLKYAVVKYIAVTGNEVLLHVSELAWERTENVADVVNMGDVFQVKYLGLDPKTRKEKVSRKALLPRPPRES